METDRLKEFLIVAKHGKLTPAARELFMSPSTLSDHIIALENELGGPLFERSASGFTLTEAGENNLERAQRILMECTAMQKSCSHHEGKISSLRIPNYMFGLDPLLAVKEAFQAGHPGQHMVFKTNELQMADPFDVLEEGQADITCLYTIEDSGQDPYALIPEKYDWVTVGGYNYIVLTSKKHPLAEKPVFDIEDLDGAVFLTTFCPLAEITGDGLKARLAQLGAKAEIMYRKLNRHDDILVSNLDGYMVIRAKGASNLHTDYSSDIIVHTTSIPIRILVHLVWDPIRLDTMQLAYLGEVKRAAQQGETLLNN